MEDNCIISLYDKNEFIRITNIEKQEIQYFYKALIVQDHFSKELKDDINEYWECINVFSLILADALEDKIKVHNFILQKSRTKIFHIEFKDDYVTFFSKLPTSKGFIDDYPN